MERTENNALDFRRLYTPPEHGDVLVEPAARTLPALVEANRTLARSWPATLGGMDLGAIRRTVRRELADDADAPIVVVGHQPEFFHAGVWAKHVVASRLAAALGGEALNLAVDSDVPQAHVLLLPKIREERLVPGTVRYAGAKDHVAFEHVAKMSKADRRRFGDAVRQALGDRFAPSLMPAFLTGLLQAPEVGDWVDQLLFARRHAEAELGVRVRDHRISACWGGPLLAEMMTHAARFTEAYNRALADYRQAQRIRGRQRPMPDLTVADGRYELPVWIYGDGGDRQRLFVEPTKDVLNLFADSRRVATVPRAALTHWDEAKEVLSGVDELRGIRPRALTLTLWARLLLADLFIHGIGGAKYDRVTDRLIRNYFGFAPPAMACVSATLHLPLPHHAATPAMWRAARRRLRDLRHNPQRHVSPTAEVAPLLAERDRTVMAALEARATTPLDHARRRALFEAIRAVNRRILACFPELERGFAAEADRLRQYVAENTVADAREFFFALFSREDLKTLLDRLPDVNDFGV